MGIRLLSKQRPSALGTGAAAIDELNDIGDVNASSPSDGQVLTWEDTPGEWQPKTPGVGGGGDYWTDVVLGSDFATDQATQQNTNLKFTPASTHTYLVRVVAIMKTNPASVAPRIGVKWPTAGLDSGSARIGANTSDVNFQTKTINAGTDDYGQQASWVALDTWGMGTIDALFVTNGSIAGDFIVTLQSEVASTTVTMGAGSILQYREIV